MRLHVTAFALLASSASAAYVQWRYCDGYNGNTELVPEALRAQLQRHDSSTQVSLGFLGRTGKDNCNALSSALNATIDIALLGGSTKSVVETDSICSRVSWPKGDNESALLGVPLSIDTDIIYPVSTFHLDIHLSRGERMDETECISADITPEFTPMVKMVLQLVPAITFLAIFFIGCLRTLLDKPDITEEHADAQQLTRQSVLPGISDCLYHLQFVFLTGALSLRYPGFYQPVVSHLNWFSLLTSSNALTHGVTYPSVNDGIYEINGTYGGTYGLELMTQIVGAPMTKDLWLNMIILITFISIAVALLLEVNWFFTRNQQARLQEEEQEQQSQTGFRPLISQVLSLVLSYFLLPLVTLSAYQIDHASIFPAYHTSLAVGFIVIIVLAFLWLLDQLPIRSLGVLIMNRSKAYQPIPSAGGRDDAFVLSFFVLTFIRAIGIGGLQISPVAQITVLIISEMICIVCVFTFRPDSIISTGTICATSRLSTLLLMTAFLPGTASLSVKSIIGYILLFQQVIVLFAAILLPSAYRLARLCLAARRNEVLPVYSLRQLRRRQTRDSINHEPDIDRVTHSNGTKDASQNAPLPLINTPRDLEHDRSSISSRYYRPPRTPSRGASSSGLSVLLVDDTDLSRPSSSSGTSAGAGRERHMPEVDMAARSSSSSPTSLGPPDAASTPEVPLGPRWGDYSFREVDLAYGRPPHEIPNRAQLQAEAQPHRRQVSGRSLVSMISGWSGPKQKGFEVDRGSSSSR